MKEKIINVCYDEPALSSTTMSTMTAVVSAPLYGSIWNPESSDQKSYISICSDFGRSFFICKILAEKDPRMISLGTMTGRGHRALTFDFSLQGR